MPLSHSALLFDTLKIRRVQYALGGAAAVVFVPWAVKKIGLAMWHRHLDGCAAKLRDKREASVQWARAAVAKLDPKTKAKIAAMSFDGLREALQSGEVTALDTLLVYISLALDAHAKTNCITGFIESSLERAAKLDELSRQPEYKKGPLFGIPVSVKEALPVAGELSTFGSAKLMHVDNKKNASFVDAAINNGAVPFVRTNVPLACMGATTMNRVYGHTTNPLASDRSAGGSSGGEGALIASGGSLLGFGSDVGGSVRLPAAYCGIAAFKPTTTRISNSGYDCFIPGRPFVMPTDGPLAPTIAACALMFRLAVGDGSFMHALEPSCPPVPFNDLDFEKGRKYTIGYFDWTGELQSVPSQMRAVREAAERLQRCGHTLVAFTPHGIDDAAPLAASLFAPDGGIMLGQLLTYELCPPEYAGLRDAVKMSNGCKKLLGYLHGFLGNTSESKLLLKTNSTSADISHQRSKCQQWSFSDVLAHMTEFYTFRDTFYKAMQDAGVDALLCPPTYTPTPHQSWVPHLEFHSFTPTMIFNMLDYPAGVVKVSEWSRVDQNSLEEMKPENTTEREFVENCKSGLDGFPLAVQVVAPSYKDEVVLRILCDLEDSLKR